MPSAKIITLLLIAVVLLPGCHSPKQPDFDRMRSLTGDWYLVDGMPSEGRNEPGIDTPFVSYAISEDGLGVTATQYEPGGTRSSSLYYVDQGRLRLDHDLTRDRDSVVKMEAVNGAGDRIMFHLADGEPMPELDDVHLWPHVIVFDGPNQLTLYWNIARTIDPTTARVRSAGSVHVVDRRPAR